MHLYISGGHRAASGREFRTAWVWGDGLGLRESETQRWSLKSWQARKHPGEAGERNKVMGRRRGGRRKENRQEGQQVRCH